MIYNLGWANLKPQELKYTAKLGNDAAQLLESGESLSAVARKLYVSRPSLRNWRSRNPKFFNAAFATFEADKRKQEAERSAFESLASPWGFYFFSPTATFSTCFGGCTGRVERQNRRKNLIDKLCTKALDCPRPLFLTIQPNKYTMSENETESTHDSSKAQNNNPHKPRNQKKT